MKRALLVLVPLLVFASSDSRTIAQPPPPGATCSAMLVVYDVQVRSGCRIDERVTAAPARLTYPCAGGRASASFGGSRFDWTVSGTGDVDIQIQTGFDFSDGCHWTTKQEITGSLHTGALSYAYREEPDRGQHGCAGACVASASVRIE